MYPCIITVTTMINTIMNTIVSISISINIVIIRSILVFVRLGNY